jgi:hypothetical protein
VAGKESAPLYSAERHSRHPISAAGDESPLGPSFIAAVVVLGDEVGIGKFLEGEIDSL